VEDEPLCMVSVDRGFADAAAMCYGDGGVRQEGWCSPNPVHMDGGER
jgi:hypothetical protein